MTAGELRMLAAGRAIRLAREIATADASDADRIRGVLARMVASGAAHTRPGLVAATGLARSTVSTHVDALLAAGVLLEEGSARPARGRPAARLVVGAQGAVILIAELTPHHAHMALVRLDRTVLAEETLLLELTAGPEITLARMADHLQGMLDAVGGSAPAGPPRPVAVVVTVPGPVDFRRGVPVRPPIMPGWDEYPVGGYFTERFGCPSLVDNDVNAMALGEARVLPKDQSPLLFVKVGTGIGAGLVTAAGQLHRGADGAAGDLGHVTAYARESVMCSCGNVGCLEALASAEAITGRLREALGNPELTQVDLERLVREGDALATRLVRDAAATIGELVASFVHFFNPARIVIGGALTAVSDDLLAGVRSVVYSRALPLATRNLTLAHSTLGPASGIVGAAVLGIERVLSPAGIAALGE